eukprot:256371-Prorocentrum_minimum.AAC.3
MLSFHRRHNRDRQALPRANTYVFKASESCYNTIRSYTRESHRILLHGVLARSNSEKSLLHFLGLLPRVVTSESDNFSRSCQVSKDLTLSEFSESEVDTQRFFSEVASTSKRTPHAICCMLHIHTSAQ